MSHIVIAVFLFVFNILFKIIDFDLIEPLVLRIHRGLATYHGTTEYGRFQTIGDAELALTEDCLYSQVIGYDCCHEQGILRIPILTMKNIRQQPSFNGYYRPDYPHMVITYIIADHHGKHEYQAAWQMSHTTYNQWKNTIEKLRDRFPPSEFA